MAEEDEKFIRLRNADNSFQERSDFVFAKLDGLAPKAEHEERKEKEKNMERKRRTRLPKRVPDHVLSPDKWTKYSLKIDGSENLHGMDGHNINKYAAHTFLEDLRKRKDHTTEEKQPEQLPENTKVSFHKPSSTKTTESSQKGVWKDGTFVMPEYVAGTSRPKRRSLRHSGGQPSAGCAKVSLGHLGGDEEGDECESSKVDEGKEKKRVFRKRKLDEKDEINDIEENENKKKKDEVEVNDSKQNENETNESDMSDTKRE